MELVGGGSVINGATPFFLGKYLCPIPLSDPFQQASVRDSTFRPGMANCSPYVPQTTRFICQICVISGGGVGSTFPLLLLLPSQRLIRIQID